MSTADGRSAISALTDVNLNRLVVFATVVEAGSLTAAAARLGMAKTMVSAHMQRLEQEVGASLLLRTTRALRLTEAGEAFYAASRRIVSDAEAAIAEASQATGTPHGRLRVTAPIDYGAVVVAPVAVALQQRYPALRIELLSGDRVFDLVADQIDLAIRIGRLTDSGLRAVRIGSFADCLVASPELFRHRTWPQAPSDLAGLPFIALSVLPHALDWTFTCDGQPPQDVRFEATLSTNTAHALRSATVAGGGLAILPDFVIGSDIATGRLVRVLPEWQLPTGGIHAVFPAASHMARKTRVLIEALQAHVASMEGVTPADHLTVEAVPG